MSGILLVILPPISLRDLNGCKVSMCCTQWVGMHLAYLQSNMQLRYFLLNPCDLFILLLCNCFFSFPPRDHQFLLTDRYPSKDHNIEKH